MTALNHRVTVLAASAGTDSVGQPVKAWVEQGKRWANVRVLNGVETLRAGAEIATTKASIRMRHCADIDVGMRIAYDGVTYDIKARLPDGTRRYVDFVCEATQ